MPAAVEIHRTLSEHFADHGRSVRTALARVLAAMPFADAGPRALAARLGINKSLASRVQTAARTEDSLSVLVGLPGPVTLRQFLAASRAAGVSEPVVAAAESALRAFEHSVTVHFADRTRLEAFISERLPGARAKVDAGARQAVFRGMSALKGVAADNFTTIHIARDWNEPTFAGLEILQFDGFFGLRRLRAESPMQLVSRHMNEGDVERLPLLNGGADGFIARDFCKPSALDFVRHEQGETSTIEIVGTSVGLSAAVDVAHVERVRTHYPPERRGMRPRIFHHAVLIDTPAKSLLFDLILHQELAAHYEPRLRVLDSSLHGFLGNVPGQIRPGDIYPCFEELEVFEGIAPPPKSAGPAAYDQIVNSMFAAAGWDPTAFRAIRCEMPYPVHGSQVTIELVAR